MEDSGNGFYGFDDFRVDPVKRLVLTEKGAPIALTSKAFDTLLYLVNNRGRVVGKDELMSAIWPDTFVEENTLSQNIASLRRLLGEKRGDHRFIVTVPGRGFKFVADVTQSDRDDTEKQVSGKALLPPVVDRHRRVIIGAILLLVVACIAAGYYTFKTPRPPVTSIAVLPFRNETGDPNLDHLSDGLSESLIDRLSKLSQLKVISRSSSFKYRGANLDLDEVATKLGAQAIVIGRVYPVRDKLMIRVEMIDALDDQQLWSQQYERDAVDTLTLQREMAQTISEKLRLKLIGSSEQQFAKQDTTSPEAYESLVKARFYWSRGEPEDVKKAIDHLNQAIVADPHYAAAYGELSSALSKAGLYGVFSPQETSIQADAAARRALELDDNSAQGHLALAKIKTNAWDWAGADAEYRRAIELNPNYAEAFLAYSNYLTAMARHGEAVQAIKRARELDPLSLRLGAFVGWTYALAREPEQAIQVLKETLELDPNFIWTHRALAFAYLGKGMNDEAIAEFNEEKRLSNNKLINDLFLGVAYARAGKREQALAILKKAETSEKYVSPGELYVLYTALDMRDKAFASLEKAYAAHDPQLQFIKIDFLVDSLRGDPRFIDMLKRMNFGS